MKVPGIPQVSQGASSGRPTHFGTTQSDATHRLEAEAISGTCPGAGGRAGSHAAASTTPPPPTSLPARHTAALTDRWATTMTSSSAPQLRVINSAGTAGPPKPIGVLRNRDSRVPTDCNRGWQSSFLCSLGDHCERVRYLGELAFGVLPDFRLRRPLQPLHRDRVKVQRLVNLLQQLLVLV